MFERTKAFLDFVSHPDRYRSDGEVDIDEETDPSEWRDASSPTLTERLASRKAQFATVAFFAFIALGLVAVYSRRYLPELYGNPYIKVGLLVVVVAVGAFLTGVKFIRGKLGRIDWLVMLVPSKQGIGFYVGSFDEDTAGNAVFEPLKGFDIVGLRGEPLTLGDLGDDFARSFAKRGRGADAQATIRLEDALYANRETFLGTVSCALTGGLEVDEFGRESDLYTAPPDVVDAERYKKLSNTLEQMKDKNNELETRLDAKKEDVQYWKNQAQANRDEVISEFVENHGQLAESGFKPQAGRRGGSDLTDSDLRQLVNDGGNE